MFCNNCGSKVADGSNFCSVCGSRITPAETFTVDRFQSAHHEVEPERTFSTEKRPAVSFDWNDVKDEPRRKVVTDVVSPWGSTSVEEKHEERDAVEEEQRSRTMSFIDILKKEREEKAAAAQEQARPVTEREDTVADYSVFEQAEKPSFYMPPLYEDVETIVEEAEEPEEPAYVSKLEAELAAILEAGQKKPETEIAEEYLAMDEYASDRRTEELTYVDDRVDKHAADSVESLESLLDEMDDEQDDDFTFTDLQIENEKEEDVYDGVFEPDDSPLEPSTDFVDYETLMADLTGLNHDEEPAHEEVPVYEETPVYEEEPLFEINPIYEEPAAFEEVTIEESVEKAVEETVAVSQSPEDARISEIEELKRRLAELMGETQVEEETALEVENPASIAAFAEALNSENVADADVEVTEAAEEPSEVQEEISEFTPSVEEIVTEDAEDKAEDEDNLPLIDPTPVVEEELSLINEEVEEEEIEEGTQDNPETDAMSVEDLEKDLFGEVSQEDIVAEETKKIDKFYTLYRKNEEFQRLLDEEYDRLRREEEEEVPTVSAVLDKAEEKAVVTTEESAKAAKQEAAQSVVETAQAAPVTELIQDEEAPGKGGTALTVIAVIVAILLVILLAVILVLNFAPDSGIALKLDSVIETITSYFSAVDVPGNNLL